MLGGWTQPGTGRQRFGDCLSQTQARRGVQGPAGVLSPAGGCQPQDRATNDHDEQPGSDHTRAFDPKTGRNFVYDKEKKAWTDTKTGESICPKGRRTTPTRTSLLKKPVVIGSNTDPNAYPDAAPAGADRRDIHHPRRRPAARLRRHRLNRRCGRGLQPRLVLPVAGNLHAVILLPHAVLQVSGSGNGTAPGGVTERTEW